MRNVRGKETLLGVAFDPGTRQRIILSFSVMLGSLYRSVFECPASPTRYKKEDKEKIFCIF